MRGSSRPALHTLLLFLAVFLFPLVWWLYLALRDPRIEFLPPGRGAWIVDGRWDVHKSGAPLFPPVRFRLRFEAPSGAGRPAPVRITALGDFLVQANGRPCLGSGARRELAWKRPRHLDLAPCLAAGPNEIVVLVGPRDGPPAFRLAGKIPGGGALTTGSAPWETSLLDEAWQPAALAGRDEHFLAGKRLPREVAGVSAGLAVLIALLAVAALWRGREAPEEPPPTAAAFWRRQGPVAAALVLVAAAHFWNAERFPFLRSHLDRTGHVEHIRYAARTWRPALASEGWQMYQPPLYYWVAGRLYLAGGGDERPQAALRRVQALGGWVGLFHGALIAAALAWAGPASARSRALALLAVGLAPAALTTGAMLTNEPFAALLCALPVVAALGLLRRGPVGPMGAAALGLLCGLALLSKFTGAIPVAALSVTLGAGVWKRRGAERRRAAAALLLLFVVAAAVAGPYYARNVRVYGKPFVGNWDEATGQSYEQTPGYRTARFYTRFGELFFHRPERARWSSFWDGLYASWWGEIHGNFLGRRASRNDRAEVAIFAMALLPTLAAAAGLARSARRAVLGAQGGAPGSAADLLLVATIVFGFASMAAFTLVVPFRSAVKGFFLLLLSAPGAVLMSHGLARAEAGLGRWRWLVSVLLAVLAALVLHLFLWR